MQSCESLNFLTLEDHEEAKITLVLLLSITGLVPYEQVVAALAADTLDQVSCLGLKGSRFMPEEFSQLACVSLKVN